MTDLDLRLTSLTDEDPTEDVMVRCAALAEDATAAGEGEVAALAKSQEAYCARHLALQQHCVVAGAELIGMWEPLARGPRWASGRARRLLYGVQCATGAAMDLPEIPLDTVRELIRFTERVLDHQGAKPFLAWAMEGRLAYIRGDDREISALVDRLGPTINRYNWLHNYTSCPGCEIVQIAGWLGPDARPDEVETVLSPVLSPETAQWNDPPDEVRRLDVVVGSGVCESGRAIAPRLLARSHARAGNHAVAERYAATAARRSKEKNHEERARVVTMRLDVARAGKKEEVVKRGVKELLGHVDHVEDAYELHDAVLTAALAIAAVGTPRSLAGPSLRLGQMAVDLAARLDRRLDRPRHEERTRRELEEARAASAP